MRIFNWDKLNLNEQRALLLRPEISQRDELSSKVLEIISEVKAQGDRALIELTQKFDHVFLKDLNVDKDSIKKANSLISDEVKKVIYFASSQIQKYHEVQLPKIDKIETCTGVLCERQARPIEKVGLYIPGGSAPLISTALMLGLPAKIAKCPLIVLCTPPNKAGEIDPHLLFAADLCGIEHIYKVGGAQAIAAMAYGTETIPKVDKIFGPGNAWVTQAKMLVALDPGGAALDLPAGPSEVLVIADESASPQIVAADLLSQAEHGVDSQVILICLSQTFAEQVRHSLNLQVEKLTRVLIAKKALMHSFILVSHSIEQAIEISNSYAPEHLILNIENAEIYKDKIQNAGAVFLGAWAPETVGDYVTGSNHVLPTYGHAKARSGLSLNDFMKYINFQKITKEGLLHIGKAAETLASIEGLGAHKEAVSLRLRSVNNSLG